MSARARTTGPRPQTDCKDNVDRRKPAGGDPLKLGDMVETFEMTEADVPERRRGQEYKEAAKQRCPKDDPVENWVARADKVPEALKLAAEKKAKKGYSG